MSGPSGVSLEMPHHSDWALLLIYAITTTVMFSIRPSSDDMVDAPPSLSFPCWSREKAQARSGCGLTLYSELRLGSGFEFIKTMMRFDAWYRKDTAMRWPKPVPTWRAPRMRIYPTNVSWGTPFGFSNSLRYIGLFLRVSPSFVSKVIF